MIEWNAWTLHRLVGGAALLVVWVTAACGSDTSVSDRRRAIDVQTSPLVSNPKTSQFVIEAANSVQVQTGASLAGGIVGARGTGTGPFLSGGAAIAIESGAMLQSGVDLNLASRATSLAALRGK